MGSHRVVFSEGCFLGDFFVLACMYVCMHTIYVCMYVCISCMYLSIYVCMRVRAPIGNAIAGAQFSQSAGYLSWLDSCAARARGFLWWFLIHAPFPMILLSRMPPRRILSNDISLSSVVLLLWFSSEHNWFGRASPRFTTGWASPRFTTAFGRNCTIHDCPMLTTTTVLSRSTIHDHDWFQTLIISPVLLTERKPMQIHANLRSVYTYSFYMWVYIYVYMWAWRTRYGFPESKLKGPIVG